MALPQIAIIGTLTMLIGCSPPPGSEAGSRIPPSDQPVVLLPLDGLLAQSAGGVADEASAAALAARAARLRAQASGP